MSMNSRADLGYGVKIVATSNNKTIYNKLLLLDDEEDAKAEKELAKQGFETINNFTEDWEQQDFILCIKESVVTTYDFNCLDKSIKANKLIVKPEWDIKLLEWAKENKIKSPKIGWWLLTSYN